MELLRIDIVTNMSFVKSDSQSVALSDGNVPNNFLDLDIEETEEFHGFEYDDALLSRMMPC